MSTFVPDVAPTRPRTPAWLVDRPRLEVALDDPAARQVTTVCAPSGAGKTTMVAAWAERQPAARVAWLSIGRDHRSAGAFLEAVVGLLASVTGGDPVGPTSEGAQRARLDAVLHAGDGEPLTLVIDDVHELRTRRAVDALNRLLDVAPTWLHVILVSRADPPIRIGRLKVDGRFEAIRNVDLAMTLEEAAELFARHGVAIRRDDLRLLWRRTEGWAAGLALVALAVAGGADAHAFATDPAATDAAVSDYLLGEVLSRLDGDDTACLLRLSPVEEITPDLAVALTADPTAARRLADLERQGVFLTTTDGERFRFHSLMAALLRAHLRREDPELARHVHHVAARWYVDHDQPLDAVEHAIASEDWDLVGRLVVDRWLSGLCAGELAAHLDGVPREVLLRTRALAAVSAAASSAAGRRADAARFIEVLGELEPGGASIAETDAHHIAHLLHACVSGEGAAGLSVGDALDRPDVDPGLRVFVQLRRAELLVGLGRFDQATVVLDTVDRRAAPALGAELDAFSRLVAALSGRPADASSLPASTSDSERAGCITLVAEAIGRAVAGQSGRVPALDDPAVERVLGGSHALTRCVAVLRACGPSRTWLDRSIASDPLADRLLVTLGVLEAYDQSGTHVVLGGEGEDALRRAREALATGGTRTAIALLEPWIDRDAGCHPRTRVEMSVLSAVACDRSGAGDAADRHLVAALRLGHRTGVRAPLLGSAPELEPRIARVAVESSDYQSLALALLETCREPEAQAYTQQLTAKELVVLRFLPTLMSNAEIAATMNVSVNTVKTHLKGLYRKLGVERRREAVLRGRQLELLS